jgi:tetratricopeptide (TPR) repeat protein
MMSPKQRRFARVLIPLTALCVCAFIGYALWTRFAPQWLAQQTREALQEQDFTRAWRLADLLLQRKPDSPDALRAAGEAAAQLGQTELALRYYERLRETGASITASDHLAIGELQLRRNRPSEAERHFRAALSQDPDLYRARLNLIYVLSVECRTYAARSHRYRLLREGVWTTEDLLYLAKPEDLMGGPELDAYVRREPDNPYLLLANGRRARLLHRYEDATDWVERALAVKPDLVEAHVDWGLLLLEGELTEEALSRWHRELPPEADDHPEVWFVRGFWARQRGDIRGAARCFAEVLRRDPNHRSAAHQLSLALAAQGEEALAREFSDRVHLLDELSRTINGIYEQPEVPLHWLNAAQRLESLGRLWEAAAWYRTLAGRNQYGDLVREKIEELSGLLTSKTPVVAAEDNPLRKLDLRPFPMPDFGDRRPVIAQSAREVGGGIRFAEIAQERGLNFSFIGADRPVRRLRSIFEVFGGGLAILDFDGDGWPDIYCAQGASESDGESASHRDRMFRNVQGAFVDVTTAAGLGDEGFSHGAAVGDFNNDGFADLLVAGVGENRLYRNNGDGTFEDVTASAGIAGSRWTMSCVLADLNGDSLPDIYEVNYLGGPKIHLARCGECAPRDFPAEPDRFYLNLGDGRFLDQTQEAGITAPDGRGLGVVVADFDGDRMPSVFVANDTTANHFYVNQAPRGAPPRFVDRATLAGLAYDRNGLSQACMGIALDDIDADGWLDLLVTNFFNEPNTLYRGQPGPSFEDATRAAGLHGPTLPMLGFGAEFLDADLDGDPDLAITNGHVDDLGREGAEFQMRPQFFENQTGTFVERSGSEVGAYFDRNCWAALWFA